MAIELEDIGNVCLDTFNDLGFEWILIIHTKEGLTEIIEYGPLISDLKYPPANVSYTYNRFDFSEKKVKKRIDTFLNDTYRNITQAFEIPFVDAKEKIRNLVEFIK